MKALWNKTKTWLNTNNHLLWTSIIVLIAVGLMGVYFIGPYQATRLHFEPNLFFNKFWPFALVGTIILFAFSKLSKKWVLRISWILGIVGVLLILKTIVDPVLIKGSARWVPLGQAYIDPFILTLPAYVVLMSHWLSKDKANQTLTAIGTTLLTLFIVGTAFIAPYVFMAQVYLLLFCILVFMARKEHKGMFKISIVTLIIFVGLLALAFWQLPHVQARFLQMFSAAPVNSQTYIAQHALINSTIIGNTQGSLHWLSILPDSIHDYMLTSMIAKCGILVGLLILALYGCVAKGLTDTIRNTKDQFDKILSAGTLGLFAIYTIMALAVAFGVFAAAAYWPFISFGGNMLLTWCVLFGFVLAMNKNK